MPKQPQVFVVGYDNKLIGPAFATYEAALSYLDAKFQPGDSLAFVRAFDLF